MALSSTRGRRREGIASIVAHSKTNSNSSSNSNNAELCATVGQPSSLVLLLRGSTQISFDVRFGLRRL